MTLGSIICHANHSPTCNLSTGTYFDGVTTDSIANHKKGSNCLQGIDNLAWNSSKHENQKNILQEL